jgi:hypothetical protein
MLARTQAMLTKIRLRTADMQKTRFSDYELTSALNDARTILWIALAERASTIPLKRVEIALSDGRAPLPDDYYSLVSIHGGAVEADGVTGESTVSLVYNSVPPPATENVDIPASLVIDVVEIAAAVAQGQTDTAASIAMASAARVSQKREYAAIPDRRHFP